MEAVPLLGSEETEKTEPSVRPSGSVAARAAVMAVSSAPSAMSSPVMDAESSTANSSQTVSYTHLTLPTISCV